MNYTDQRDPLQIAVEVMADGEGLRFAVSTPYAALSFVVPTELVPALLRLTEARHRGAVALRAALQPPAPPLPAPAAAPPPGELPSAGELLEAVEHAAANGAPP